MLNEFFSEGLRLFHETTAVDYVVCVLSTAGTPLLVFALERTSVYVIVALKNGISTKSKPAAAIVMETPHSPPLPAIGQLGFLASGGSHPRDCFLRSTVWHTLKVITEKHYRARPQPCSFIRTS